LISIIISGGTSPYFQNWNGVNPNVLCAGTYIYEITDVNACSLLSTSIVVEPTALLGQIYQNGNSLDAFTNGGTQPYVLLWNTGENTQSITPQQNGLYWLLITDNNGCVSDTSFFIFDLFSNIVIEQLIGDKILIKITDVFGRETKGKKNEPLFYIYDDGKVEKRITIE